MKTNLKFAVAFLLAFLASCNSSQDPATWFNTINDAEDKSRKAFSTIGEKMERQEYALDEVLQQAIADNNKGIEEIKALPALANGETYRQTVLGIMTDYDSFFSKYIPNYLHMIKDSVSDEEVTKIQNEFENALKVHQQHEEKVLKEQDIYFKEFKLNLK